MKLFITLLAAAILSGCVTAQKSENPYRIDFVDPTTGRVFASESQIPAKIRYENANTVFETDTRPLTTTIREPTFTERMSSVFKALIEGGVTYFVTKEAIVNK